MDLMSILGWVLAIFVILFGIMFDSGTGGFIVINLKSFFDLPSIVVVLGGVIAALMVSFPLKCFTRIPRHLKIILLPTKYNPQEYIDQIVELATEARINGLLSLEEKLKDTKDVFLRNSMMLVVDAVEPEKVKTLLETELEYLDERHAQDRAFYDKASAYSPAFGMIGTLIGLINMLKNLSDSDMETLGPSMSVALITTFYGSLLAHVLFNPIASNLTARDEEEILCRQIIVEGIMAIQSGENPKFLRERLMTFMNQKLREGGESGGGTGEKKERKRRKEK